MLRENLNQSEIISEEGNLEEGNGATQTWSKWKSKKVTRRELPICCHI